MRRGAVILAASISLTLGACTMDKSSELAGQSGVQTDERASSSVEDGDGFPSITKDSGHDSAHATLAQAPAKMEDSTLGAQPVAVNSNAGRDDGVRDAKEAAEEAARKILDATLGAASKIKEVSLGAVQSVLDSSTRSSGEQGSDELAANGGSTNPAE